MIVAIIILYIDLLIKACMDHCDVLQGVTYLGHMACKMASRLQIRFGELFNLSSPPRGVGKAWFDSCRSGHGECCGDIIVLHVVPW